MDGNWIKLHRKTLDSAIADDPTMLGCWVWILLRANWKGGVLRDGTTLQPGQLMVGYRPLARAWKCSISTAHARIRIFENLKMIRTESRTESRTENRTISERYPNENRTRGTIITICNWGTYQRAVDDGRTISERSPNDIRTENRTIAERDRRRKEEVSNARALFDAFWRAYPRRNGRKVGKAATAAAFAKLSPEDQSLVLMAVANYGASKVVRDGYAKDPIRFLRRDFWKDWLEPAEDGESCKVFTIEELEAQGYRA